MGKQAGSREGLLATRSTLALLCVTWKPLLCAKAASNGTCLLPGSLWGAQSWETREENVQDEGTGGGVLVGRGPSCALMGCG